MNKKPIITHDAVYAVSAKLPALAGRILTGGLALLLIPAAFGGRAWSLDILEDQTWAKGL